MEQVVCAAELAVKLHKTTINIRNEIYSLLLEKRANDLDKGTSVRVLRLGHWKTWGTAIGGIWSSHYSMIRIHLYEKKGMIICIDYSSYNIIRQKKKIIYIRGD